MSMNIRHYKKQVYSGQCGIFTLANIIRNENIIKIYGEDKDYMPCGVENMDKILRELGYDYRISRIIGYPGYDTFIRFEELLRILNSYVDSFSKEDIYVEIIPFLLNIQLGNDEKSVHSVGLVWIKGDWYYSDPKEGEMRYFRLSDLYYIRVISVSVIEDINTYKMCGFIDKEEYINAK